MGHKDHGTFGFPGSARGRYAGSHRGVHKPAKQNRAVADWPACSPPKCDQPKDRAGILCYDFPCRRARNRPFRKDIPPHIRRPKARSRRSADWPRPGSGGVGGAPIRNRRSPRCAAKNRQDAEHRPRRHRDVARLATKPGFDFIPIAKINQRRLPLRPLPRSRCTRERHAASRLSCAPYMHDGSLASLEAVIDHYGRGGIDRPSRSELIKKTR